MCSIWAMCLIIIPPREGVLTPRYLRCPFSAVAMLEKICQLVFEEDGTMNGAKRGVKTPSRGKKLLFPKFFAQNEPRPRIPQVRRRGVEQFKTPFREDRDFQFPIGGEGVLHRGVFQGAVYVVAVCAAHGGAARQFERQPVFKK